MTSPTMTSIEKTGFFSLRNVPLWAGLTMVVILIALMAHIV